MIQVIDNFISEERARALLDFCRGFDISLFIGDGYWESKSIPLRYETPEVKAIKEAALLGIREAIRKVSGKALYPDCTNLVRWTAGDWMGLHADGEYDGGEFNWRLFGAILYLNDDYEGGQIHFPNQGVELKPKAGTLVFFPGHKPYVHGVKEITRGERYTMASFWAADKVHNRLECLND